MYKIETYKAKVTSILHRNILFRAINQLLKMTLKKGKECSNIRFSETSREFILSFRISKETLLNRDTNSIRKIFQYYIKELDDSIYDEFQD